MPRAASSTRDRAGERRARMAQATWAMTGVLLLAALLRFHRLDYQSLWFDELMSWLRASLGTLGEVGRDAAARNWPPAYFFLLHGVIKTLGDTAFVMRFPSALAGVMGVAALYALGRRLYDPMTGVVASALMAVLWAPVFYGQEARAYSFILLFAILSTLFWHRLLTRLDGGATPRGWDVAGYAASALALAYLHYFGVLFVFLQGAAAGLHLLRKPRRLLKIAGLYLAIAAGYLPQMAALFDSAGRASGWIAPPPAYPIALIATLAYFFNNQPVVAGLALGLMLTAGLFAALGRGRGGRIPRPSALDAGWLLVGWLIALPTIIYLRSVLFSPVYLYRYLLLSAPAAYLLLARALTGLPGGKGVRAAASAAMIALALGNLLFDIDYYATPFKEQIREAVGYVTAHGGPDADALVIGYNNGDHLDYYFEKLGDGPRVDIVAGRAEDIPAVADLLAEREPRTVWYVAVQTEPEEAFVAYLNEHLTLVEHEEWLRAEVWRFEGGGGVSTSAEQ